MYIIILICGCLILVSIIIHFMYKISIHKSNLGIEGEIETIDWWRKRLRLDFNCLDDLWEFGAKAVSQLLEDDSETWREIQETAVRKIKISPALNQEQLNNPCLENSSRQNFVLFLKKIMKFVEKSPIDDTNMKISNDILARGVGLYAAYTHRRAVFYVYSMSDDLNGIKVYMKGPGDVQVERKIRRGRMMFGYVAPQRGTYFLKISKYGLLAPGSPFEVFVDDSPPGYYGNFGSAEWDLLIKKPLKIKQKKFYNTVRLMINVRRLFKKKLDIPQIQISNFEEPSFSVWSSMTEFGPPRRGSFTFISSEGSTFPLSSQTDSKFFDNFDNLDIFKNETDLWAVQTDQNDKIDKECLVISRRNSEEVYKTPCKYLIINNKMEGSVHGEQDFDDNNQINDSIISDIKSEEKVITQNENVINLFKESNLKKYNKNKINSLPSFDHEVYFPEENNLRKRRCRSILSLFDFKKSKKNKDLRRTKSAISRICLKNTKKIDEIRPVKKLKNYWDNLIEKKNVDVKKTCSIEITGIVAKGKIVFEELAKQNNKSIQKSKKFEKKNIKNQKIENESNKKSFERDLQGMFEDMNHGIGMPGIPNRLGLLASLRSIDQTKNAYEPEYPHLPTTKPSDYKSRNNREFVPWNQILSAF